MCSSSPFSCSLICPVVEPLYLYKLLYILNIVYYTIISLFYFELDLTLKEYNREYTGTGFILYKVHQGNPVFRDLFN